MRIGIFTDTYKPEINGVITSIEIFRKQLEAMGHEVYLFCPMYFGKKDPAPGVFRFPSTPYLFKTMTERRFVYPSFRVFRSIRRLNLDIVHSQVPANTGLFAILVSRLEHIPHVHTYHTLFMEYTHYMPVPRPIAVHIVESVSRWFCGRSQCIISPSARIRRELREYGIHTPIEVIPTGIDTNPDRVIQDPRELRHRYNLPEDKKILSFVGRIGREKNIGFLLRMVRKISEARDDVILVIVGDGPDKSRLAAEARSLGIESLVRFTGYVDRETVFSVFAASAVFTFASMTETQGLVLLEAMSMGTPVVAIDAMGVSDLLSDDRGGFLCQPDDLDGFTERVNTLLDNRELYRKTAAEGQEKAREWSIETMSERLVRTYRKAVQDYRVFPNPTSRRWKSRLKHTPDTRSGHRTHPAC
jgi:1,2-diacylglycerol 3-alpha-glucosyltransferase